MSKRPSFSFQDGKVKETSYEFFWNGGFARSQKEKNIVNLHASILVKRPNAKILEVSTKSKFDIGKALSAFNLKYKGKTLENVFQSAKVYEYAGPCYDLLDVSAKDAKRSELHKTSGKLVGFKLEDSDFMWPLVPRTAFYDYIYVSAVLENEELCKEVVKFDTFTDIEFNPNKSINCQARACVIAKHIIENNMNNVLDSVDVWLDFRKRI